MAILTAERPTMQDRADWLLVFDAALRVGNFSSLDELFLRALDAWLEQLTPELRWKIAIELYTNEHISTGRAAQIAGLNYIVFMEKLRERGIRFMAAEAATGDERNGRASKRRISATMVLYLVIQLFLPLAPLFVKSTLCVVDRSRCLAQGSLRQELWSARAYLCRMEPAKQKGQQYLRQCPQPYSQQGVE